MAGAVGEIVAQRRFSVTLLGSQLAPEDLIGIPKIEGGVSRFYPPSMIVRERGFVLFIDELNIASQEIQKAFYSLIGIAAIHSGNGEIYLNPRRQLGLEQAKFVLAHEVLHAGLNRGSRRQGRDPYLWNVACDFVINDWLVGMQLGIAPPGGLLFDEELRGLPAEDISEQTTSVPRGPSA